MTPRSYAQHLLYWMDGERNLEEIIKNVYRETGVMASEFARDYCRLLADLELLDLKT